VFFGWSQRALSIEGALGLFDSLLANSMAEAYLFVIRKENLSELDIKPINFAFNETLTRGHPLTVFTPYFETSRVILIEIE
jgi:hypothetical protein